MINRHLYISKRTLLIGLKSGVLACFFGLVQLGIGTHKLYYAIAMLGVFIASIIETVALNTPQIHRLRYSLMIALGAGAATAIGSLCAGSYLWSIGFLALFMILAAITNPENPFFASVMLFVADLYVIGNGLKAPNHQISCFYGALLCFGCMSMFALEYVVTWRSLKRSGKPDKLIPRPLFAINKSTLSYAAIFTLTVAAAYSISYLLHLEQGFWVPMTALLILKECHNFSWQRVKHRFFGTAIGFIFACLIGLYINDRLELVLLLLPLYCLIVLSLARHYGAYAFFLTLMVTDLYKLADFNGLAISEHRIIDTSIGVAVVVVALLLRQMFLMVNRRQVVANNQN